MSRLSGSLSARNAATCAGVGSVPVMSSDSAANELLVGAEVGRDEAELLATSSRELIDERLRLELVVGRLDAERHRGAEDGDLALIAGHDRRLAAHVQRADQAVVSTTAISWSLLSYWARRVTSSTVPSL